MAEIDLEVEIDRHSDSLYAAMVIPFRVPCYSFTREGAIARAREWFVNLVAEYEAAGRQAQLVQEYEHLSGPDRVDTLTPAELLIKWSALHSHFRSLWRPGLAWLRICR